MYWSYVTEKSQNVKAKLSTYWSVKVWVDTRHSGEIMSLSWPGDYLVSPQESWRRWLRRGRSGCLCSVCCPHDLDKCQSVWKWMDGWMDAHVNYPNTAELNWVSFSYRSPPKSVKWQSSSLNLFELLAVCGLGFISLCKWYRLNFAFFIHWTELNLLYLNNLIQLRKVFAAWCMCICEKIHMKL